MFHFPPLLIFFRVHSSPTFNVAWWYRWADFFFSQTKTNFEQRNDIPWQLNKKIILYFRLRKIVYLYSYFLTRQFTFFSFVYFQTFKFFLSYSFTVFEEEGPEEKPKIDLDGVLVPPPPSIPPPDVPGKKSMLKGQGMEAKPDAADFVAFSRTILWWEPVPVCVCSTSSI